MDACCSSRKGIETLALCVVDYGPLYKSLKVQRVYLPQLNVDEVLIEVKAVSINPHDWKIAEGVFKDQLSIKFPYILGRDFAGYIKKIGANVEKFSRGDRVLGYQPIQYNGSFAQYIIVNQKYIAHLDESIPFDEAAAIPFSGGIAYHVVNNILKIKYNKKLWITNGSGGVGTWAIQIAKQLGGIVIATASTPNQGWIRKLGADEVIDYKSLKQDNYPKNVECVFDTQGNLTKLNPVKSMASGGKLVSIVEYNEPPLTKAYNIKFQYYEMQEPFDSMLELLDWVKDRHIIPQLVSTSNSTFLDIIKALEKSKAGHVDGKITLNIDERDMIKAKELGESFFGIEKPKPKSFLPEEEKQDKKDIE